VSVFKNILEKTKLMLLLTFPTIYVVEKVLSQVLHMRNKYRNRLDMNKTGETPHDLKVDQLATCFQKAWI